MYRRGVSGSIDTFERLHGFGQGSRESALYAGAAEGLAAAHQFADVAMVSSANRDAVEEEWGKFGLLEHTDIVLAQDVGSKAACIAEMLKFGYDPNKVVMVGDAPGDRDAARFNGAMFYPICPTLDSRIKRHNNKRKNQHHRDDRNR